MLIELIIDLIAAGFDVATESTEAFVVTMLILAALIAVVVIVVCAIG